MSVSSLTPEAVPDASTLCAISRLLHVPARVDEISHELACCRERAEEQTATAAEQADLLARLNHAVTVLAEKQELLSDASKRQAQLGDEHYQRHVIDPLSRRILQITDLGEQALRGQVRGEQAIDVVQAVQDQLLELLSVYGCESIESTCGDVFEPSFMRPLEEHRTCDPSKHRTVAASVRRGLRRGKRVLRFESVAVFCYEPTREHAERKQS